MEVCCCGNVLNKDLSYRMTICICRCKKPKSGRTTQFVASPLSNVSERRYTQRKAYGLPMKTHWEQSKEIMGDMA